MRKLVILLSIAVVALAAAYGMGCCSSPAVTSLEGGEADIEVVDGSTSTETPPRAAEPPAGAEQAPAQAPQPNGDLIPTETTYSALKLKGVNGGRIQLIVPGTVDEVLAMLLDFDNAGGHRAWAQTYRVTKRSADLVLAQWKFRGKMGIEPTVILAFKTTRTATGATVTFELRKRAFGIATYFGDYQIMALPGTPARSGLAERLFIDSGIPLANASRKDIEKGLRKDAELMRAWMAQRTKQATTGAK